MSFIALIALLVFFSPLSHATGEDAYVADSRKAVADFSAALKSELEAALYTAGPVKAIEVCQLKAPGIADQVSQARGFRIARTSLKVRNPANAPDAWERSVLEQFQAQRDKGADPGQLEFYEIVDQGGGPIFRYMKGIPTQGVCLACHGTQIAPEVKAALQQLYPQDQARGFKFGDLRGAFSITRPVTPDAKAPPAAGGTY